MAGEDWELVGGGVVVRENKVTHGGDGCRSASSARGES